MTGASEPVLQFPWVAEGAHINLVGSHTLSAREADSALIRNARVFVDSLDSALREAGDLIQPMREGVIEQSHIIGEIGRVANGTVDGRQKRG